MATPIVFLVLLLLSPAAYAATTHTAGGSDGWNTGVNYDDWSGKQTFIVGDSLQFKFDSTHAMDEVSPGDYQSCNTGNAIETHASSPTTVPLTAVGTRYFICPRSNHCSQGMKIAVKVVAAGGSPSTPTTPSTPSTPGTSPSTPAGSTPSTPSPSTPGGNGATGIRGSLVVGLVGFLVVVLGMMRS